MLMKISLMVQWLRLCIFTAGDTSLIPGQGHSTYHAVQPKKKIMFMSYNELVRTKFLFCSGIILGLLL